MSFIRKAIAISKFECPSIITTEASLTSSNNQNHYYKIYFADCGHSGIVDSSTVVKPYKRILNESYYLCMHCLYQKRGACDKMPYKRAVDIIENPRPGRRRGIRATAATKMAATIRYFCS